LNRWIGVGGIGGCAGRLDTLSGERWWAAGRRGAPPPAALEEAAARGLWAPVAWKSGEFRFGWLAGGGNPRQRKQKIPGAHLGGWGGGNVRGWEWPPVPGVSKKQVYQQAA